MSRALRLAVADGQAPALDYYREVLPALGHQVVLAARDGRALLEGCLALHPDLVLTDIRMPGLNGIDAVLALFRERPTPVILVSELHDLALLDRVDKEWLFGYLHKPVSQPDLEATITLAWSRFELYLGLRTEASELRQALEDRKLVERAKGLLMRRASLDEESAFHRLQRLARDSNRKLAEVARSLLVAEEAFRPATTNGVSSGTGKRPW